MALAVILSAGAARGADHPIVAGFERFYTIPRADAVRGGQLLLGELNCISCHAPGDSALQRKQAPILDGVGGRVRVGYLKEFLANPHAVKPGTTMPQPFADDPDRAAKVEALVHFLASTGKIRHDRIDGRSVGAGQDLYNKIGCAACHGPRDRAGEPEKGLPGHIVPLGDLKAKYSVSSLIAFLDNPRQVRPSGRMPHLVSGKEAHDVACYLLQGQKANVPFAKGSTTYAYYEGQWDKLPDFSKLKPRARGTGPAFDLHAAKRGNDYALQFEGFFKIETEGNYRFTLSSDDGSRLLIDDKVVINNDGIHPNQSAPGTTRLKKGVHKVVVLFFQGGGEIALNVQIAGPGLGQRNMADLVVATEADLVKKPEPPRKDDVDYLEIQPALVEKGASLFASAGCASCHEMHVERKLVASAFKAPALNKLKGEGGCLGDKPTRGTPWYALSASQKTALAAAIKNPPAPNKTPADQVARTMTTFNCYACHGRDKVGGPVEELNKVFQTTQPEMGDEGRIPPLLDGVGAKIVPDYFRGIVDKGSRDRPYMHTRMPAFGLANVGPLQEQFAALDHVAKVPEVKFNTSDAKVKAAGRHMVGGLTFGCVKCHTFNGVKAEGVQGIDMLLIPKRVQRDWFHAYLLNPQAIRPGTRMPAVWPEGKSFLPDLLDGKAATQIEAIWVYLQAGKSAQLPVGLGKKSIPLMPDNTAIIYRNFIQGAGPRGIAVGYPEKLSLAFDANEMRLALLWQGAFIDAARHWTDRGVGYEGPLGDNVLHLPNGVSFAVLEKADTAWPGQSAKDLGYRFRGYHLSPDDRPTFQYAMGDLAIEDFPNPTTAKEPTLRRTLKLSATKPLDNLYFRAAVGAKIEALGEGWYRIDGWKMKLDGGAPAKIRSAGGKSELLVPVRFTNNKAEIVQEFAW